ncbi:MAG TPA: hypothetical protein PLR60_01055 [Syntrophorhabdaceae bacterium]|nr:hypothetical protein [Syntrophorhabdaceae bacterium]
MKLKSLLILTALLLTTCLVLQASAADHPKEPMDSLVITMSTDNVATFNAAIRIGTVAVKRGHAVTMLLRVDSIKAAVERNEYPVNGTTLKKELLLFMKAGATVIAGGSCMKDMGLNKSDLIEGVMVGTPDIVMGALFKKDTKIISY